MYECEFLQVNAEAGFIGSHGDECEVGHLVGSYPLVMEAISLSETSGNFCRLHGSTFQKDSHFQVQNLSLKFMSLMYSVIPTVFFSRNLRRV